MEKYPLPPAITQHLQDAERRINELTLRINSLDGQARQLEKEREFLRLNMGYVAGIAASLQDLPHAGWSTAENHTVLVKQADNK